MSMRTPLTLKCLPKLQKFSEKIRLLRLIDMTENLNIFHLRIAKSIENPFKPLFRIDINLTRILDRERNKATYFKYGLCITSRSSHLRP